MSTTCQKLQERWVRLDGNAKQKVAAMVRTNATSFSAVASLTVTFRGMLHTFRRSESHECPWFSAEGAAGLGRYVQDIASQHPCIGVAREVAAAAEGQGEEAQQKADQRALLVMLSPTCDVRDAAEAEEGADIPDGAEDANMQEEEDVVLEELDEITDKLLDNALGESNGSSLLQQEVPLPVLVIGMMMAFFFGLWLLVLLPYIVSVTCVVTGMGFLVFSFLGCLLYSLVRLLLGLSIGSCPMFNWLPQCNFRHSEFHAFGLEYMHLPR